MQTVTVREQKSSGGGRVVIYDWLRLIATIFVVIGHSSYLAIYTNIGGVNYALPSNISGAYYAIFPSLFRRISFFAYEFHMPLFFMLSGAVLALRPIPDFDIFAVKKIKRLLVPYFIYGVFFMLPVKFLGGFYRTDTLLPAISAFLMGGESGHLWFLPALFWCMIVFVIMEKRLKEKTQSAFFLLLISGLIQCAYPIYIKFDFLYLAKGMNYIFWFALGYVFEHYRPRFERLELKKIVRIFTAIAALVMVDHIINIFDDNDTFFSVLAGITLSFSLACLCSKILKFESKRWWNIVIRDLFYVYIFHDPLEYIVLRIFFARDLLTFSWGCYLYIFCRFILIFAISLVFGEMVEKFKKYVV